MTYTVREKLASLPTSSDAVGRTGTLSGEVTLDGKSEVTVDLTTLASNQDRRDNRVREMFASDPLAVVTFDNLTLPDEYVPGTAYTGTATGTVTIAGVERPLTFEIEARLQGDELRSIRENAPRAEALGYDVPRMKLAAFVVGGAFSGLAGVLYAMLFGIVPLEAIGFVFSGNVVFATLIGGSGSLYGPVIGSFVFIWLSESVSAMWARWPLLLGVAFVIVVLFFRGGVVEAWARFWGWRAARRLPAGARADAPR